MASTRAILAATKAAPAGRPTPAPQGAAPYFGAVSPLVANLDAANGYTYSQAYGSFLPRPPHTFTQGAFGPFSPILPVPVDTPEESGRARPRRVQYQPGFDLPVGEPGLEGLKLVTFNTLRVLADLYSVARACIQLRKSEVRGLAWDIMPTPDAAKANKGNEKWFKDFGQRRAQALKFFQRPDPDYFSWNSFIDAFLEEVFVFDALSLYTRRKRGKGMRKGLLGSDLDCLELLSGPCYSDDTEVLTRRGWLRFAATTKADEFATRNPKTKALEWHHATYFHKEPWRGELLNFHGKGLDLLVTPNHRMLVTSRPRGVRAERHGDEWIIPAGVLADCNGATQRIPLTSVNGNPDLRAFRVPSSERAGGEYVTFDGPKLRTARKCAQLTQANAAIAVGCHVVTINRAENSGTVRLRTAEALRDLLDITFKEATTSTAFTELTGDDYAAFMGMWLSEGCVTWHGETGKARRPTIYITQSEKSKGYKPFKELLTRMLGREPAYNGASFYFRHKGLAEYLQQFGHAHEKYVPDEILSMSARQAEIFWHYYWLGDGYADRQRICTSSPRMADGLQAVAQLMGKWATIRQERAHTGTLPDGRSIPVENARTKYMIALQPHESSMWHVKREGYDGHVYCVSLPNETMYVRRNGKPSWCCNTIRPLYGIHGQYPRPPAPAYQQYLYGVPRSDFMQLITERDIEESDMKEALWGQFSGDQLLYLPMVPRRWTPYGMPFIERALIPVMSGLQKQNYALDFFSQGTVPAVYMSPGDESMTPNQIRELQDALNAFAGDPAMHHKIIVLPPGTKVMPQRDAQLADQFDEIVMTQVCCVPGTEIITRRGLLAIEDIQVGDTVLTHRGAWRTVHKTMRNPVHSPVRRITAQGLDALEVTGNHPVWTACYSQTKTHRQVYDHTEWVAARDLQPKDPRGGDFDALTIPIPVMGSADARLTTADYIAGRQWPTRVEDGFIVHPHPHVKPIPATVPMDAALGRLLGFYLAEGSASNGQVFWYFHENETAYHQQVVDDLKTVFGLDAKVTIRPESHVARVVCNSALLSELVSCGTARNKHLPEWAWDGSPDFYAALLWAWVAGDGTLTSTGWRGYTMSRTLAWQMRLVALACGHEPQFRTQAQPYSVIRGREIKRDADAPIYVLQVVLNKGARRGMYRIDGPHLTSSVRSNDLSTYDGNVVYNLEVEGDESYVTTGGTVHNCMAADVMPMELGIAPKVSTTVSPGSSNQMAKMAQAKSERKSTKPLLVFISDIMNAILMDVCHQDDMRFVFEGLEEEEDQEQLTGLIVQQVSNGLRSIDEGRDLLGLQPWGLPETSGPIFTSPTTGPVPLVAAMQAATANAETATTNAANAAAAGRQPAALPPGQQAAEQPAPAGAAAGEPGDAGTRALSTAEEANDTPGHAAAESVDDTAGRQGARGSAGSAGGTSGGKQSATSGSSDSQQQNGRSSSGPGKSDKMTVTVGLDRAVNAELEALTRHLRKGRLISTWVPKNLPPRTLAVISENIAKGLEPDQAVAFAKATTLAGDAGPKAATPSRSAPWDHSAALAARYEPRILAAFHSAAPHIRSLLEQYQSGALSVTDVVLEGMVSDVIAAALGPVLDTLWRQAWTLGDRVANGLLSGLATKDDYSFDEGDDDIGDESDLGDLADEFDQAVSPSRMSILREIATTGVAALVAALATQGVDGVMSALGDLLHLPSRIAAIAGNEVACLLNLGIDARYGASGVTMVEWLASPASCARLCIPNADQGPIPRGTPFQSGVMRPPAHVACGCALGAVDVGAQKFLRRTIPLNGQETWTEADPAAPNAAGGGGQSPVRHWADGTQAPDGVPVTGGVPGSTAGGEPPRWDTPVANGYQGGLNDLSDRTNPAQGHDGGHDSAVPLNARPVAVDARGAGYPTTGVDRWPSGGHGTDQPSGGQVPGDANDRGAWGVRKASGPIAAGIVVHAADTGRVLMLQRAMSDDDPAAGFWEPPGGCLEEGEAPNVAAKREWEEETGCSLPEGEFTGQWDASNGKYHGYVYTVAHEADVPIHDGREEVSNPDDPDGDSIESLAWWDPQHLVDNPAVRPELLGDLDRVFDALGVTVDKSMAVSSTAAPAQVKALMLRNFPASALGWVDKAQWTGPTDVPLDRIDFTNRGSWAAHHEADRVQHFADKIRDGDAPHPAILVDTPGEHDYMVVDGHHRALAYRSLGKPVPAYVGRVNAKTGPWDETHLHQHHQGADSGNE